MGDEEIVISKIVRSRRKTIALIVTREARLLVRAPLRAPLSHINELVAKKGDWIRRKLKEIAARPAPTAKEFVDGEKFLFEGRLYSLRIAEDNFGEKVMLSDHLYLASRALPEAGNVIKGWYRAEAQKKIVSRCRRLAEETGLMPKSIKITDARKRWGSCGLKGTLNFSWRLIMAPAEIMDYVIIHELVHLEQMDHSRNFWKKVGRLLPGYEKNRRWLRDNDILFAF